MDINKKAAYALAVVIAAVALYATSLKSYVLFHSMAELFSIVIAAGIFVIAWNTRKFMPNAYLLFIGVAYLYIAFIDLVHTLAYKGMGVFPGADANLPTQFWIVGRYMEAVSLFAAPCFLGKKLRVVPVVIAYFFATALLLFSIHSGVFPDAFVEGRGLTIFKVASEYIISLILAAAIIYLRKKCEYFEKPVLNLLIWSMITTIASEMAFTLYQDVYGFFNLLGHYFKIVSYYLIYAALIQTNLKKPYEVLAHEIDERKQAEEKILKLNRVYAVISQINQAIVKVREKDKILSEACRIAVEYGKFRMAWIGMIDEETHIVKPVANSGVDERHLSKIKKIFTGDEPEGRGPTGTAIRESRHYVCDDIEKDPRMDPWREEALKRGYRSSIALPIRQSGKVIGVFNLYADIPHFFDQDEIQLLDEVTNDISFAIDAIELAKKKMKAEETLRESEERLHAVIEQSPVGIAFSRDGITLDANHVYVSMFGYANIDELRGTPLINQIAPPCRQEIIDKVTRRAQGREVEITYETIGLRKDDSQFPFQVSVSRIVLPDGPLTISFFLDITDRRQAEEVMKENKRVLQLFVEYSPAAIAMFDRDMKYLVASRRFLIDYELGDQDIIGRSHYDVFPEIPDRWREIHKRCLAGAIEKSDEDPFPRADGRMDWVCWEIHPWYETGGEIGGIILFSEVITERKRAEEELIKHREHLEDMIKERTAKLERVNRLFVGRELRMKELKEKIAKLEKEGGKVS